MVYYIDDILVTGKNDQDHITTLKQICKRLREDGIQANKDKSTFLKPSVYLGHRIDEKGLHATPSKIKTIVEL